jgi:hypothetical protein
MDEDFARLADAVERACGLLLDHGGAATRPRMLELARRLRAGDSDAIVSVVSEVTGGMGSLNDQSLHPAAIDALFRDLLRDIEQKARSAAARKGIHLVR